MVNRKFDNQQAQENYLENMSLLIWQNHIIKIDKKKHVLIIGVEMEGIPYFREIKFEDFKEWLAGSVPPLCGFFYEKMDEVIKELAAEVIKWREEKETKEYKD
jgi:hypothetical protein